MKRAEPRKIVTPEEIRSELRLVSPWCCWGAAILSLIIGLVCVIVVGSVKRKVLEGASSYGDMEILDVTLILLFLGVGPGAIFFLLCSIGILLKVREYRSSRAGFRKTVPSEHDFIQEELDDYNSSSSDEKEQ